MTFRTPTSIFTRDALLGLQRLNERLSTLNYQMSSGKRIVRTADDPAGAALVVDLKSSVGANDQYIRQIADAAGFLQDTELITDSVMEGLARLLELGARAQDSTLTAGGRAALGAEIDGIRTNFVSYGNTKVEGKYIFAGSTTQTLPFTGLPAGPIVYGGDSNLISVDVGPGRSVVTNVTGDNLFFGAALPGTATDLFQQVTDFRDAVNTNNVPAMQTAITNLTSIFDRINVIRTDLGGRQNAMSQLKENLEQFSLTLQSIQDSVEGLDYPKAITEFTTAKVSQEATLNTLSKVSQRNLFDFLG